MLHKTLPPVLKVVQEGLSKWVKGLGSACVYPKVFPAPWVDICFIQIFFRYLLSGESKAREKGSGLNLILEVIAWSTGNLHCALDICTLFASCQDYDMHS